MEHGVVESHGAMRTQKDRLVRRILIYIIHCRVVLFTDSVNSRPSSFLSCLKLFIILFIPAGRT